MKKKIMVVDDDEKLNRLLTSYLEKHSYLIFSETDPASAVSNYSKINPDIIILDVMMPEIDGFTVLKEIRKNSMVPVIMLTARNETSDKVLGLELGADDYMEKPFEPRELAARIQSILRRVDTASSYIQSPLLTLDERTNTASTDNEKVQFTTTEFFVLKFLVKNRGLTVSREMIYEKIIGLDSDSLDRSVDVIISRIRSKLGDDSKHPLFIKTVRGKGYQFVG